MLRDRNTGRLSLECIAELQFDVVSAPELSVAQRPRGIRCTWETMQLEVDDAVMIAILIGDDVSILLQRAPRGDAAREDRCV